LVHNLLNAEDADEIGNLMITNAPHPPDLDLKPTGRKRLTAQQVETIRAHSQVK
jgi:hypothetical protein